MEENRIDSKTMMLMFLMFLMLSWLMFNSPSQSSEYAQKQQNTHVNKGTNYNSPLFNIDSEKYISSQQESQKIFGAFANNVASNANSILENDVFKVVVSNKGGQISELLIKDQLTYKKEPVYLIKDGNSSFSLKLKTTDGRTIETRDLYFTPKLEGNTLRMKIEVDKGFLEYQYTIKPSQYMIDFNIVSQGISKNISDETARLYWRMEARRMEKSVTYEDRYTQAIIQYDEDRIEKLSENNSETSTEKKDIGWVSMRQHLFTSYLISEARFPSIAVESTKLVKDESEKEQFTKRFKASIPVERTNGEFNQKMHLYFGPTDYKTLKKYDSYSLVDALPLGWGIFGWINKWFIIPVFDLLSKYMSVGIAIIVLTVLVRLILSPVQYKSYVSQAKMKILKPEIDAINAKFKDNPMKRQQETMDLYSKAGASPFSGCIPALLQMPVFFALFSFFPIAFALRQKSFLWAEDLASYDSVYQLPFTVPLYGDHISLLPILTSVTMLIYMLMTAGQMQQQKQEGVPDMRFMMYLSPLMMLVFFNNYGSGLSLYYFVSNLITIFIMLAIKYIFIDEEKIHRKIQENRQKPKKESRFQKRMREMMEQAQEEQKRRQRK